jgi:hypothetical protein
MMFGRRGRAIPPPSTPFLHDDRCKTKDAQPEWFDSADGRWERVCSCGSEYRAKESTGEIEPTSPAAEPSRRAHLHAPGCQGSEIDQVVTVEFSQLDRAWRSHCTLCTSSFLYWYEPGRTEMDLNGDLRPVYRAGIVLYDYPLAREQASA